MNYLKGAILIVVLCLFSSYGRAQGKGLQPLFAADLSNAEYTKGVWSVDSEGVLSANKDEAIWTTQQYENFVLELDFKTDHKTNSGVIVYCTDKKNWIPNSVEIQILDDHSTNDTAPNNTHSGAIYGHLAPKVFKLVKKPGEWNHYKITCKGQMITVELNGKKVTKMDMRKWTSGSVNPDGTKIPSWLPKPFAELPTKGYIGFQGKHGAALIWFKNIKIKQL